MKPIYEKTLTKSGMWSQVVGRGKTMRLTNVTGGANVGMLLYNADQLTERYNMPDTLKGQYVFYLTHPYCLHSDMGRIFASITADTAGWHDTVAGTTNAESILQQYGEKDYQDHGNDFHRNGRECFLIELGKWGLGVRDLLPNINWFSKVEADEEGKLHYSPESSEAGGYVDLRFEMNTLVVLNTCPHPFDPATTYPKTKVKLEVFETGTAPEVDPCRDSRPENQWALTNTEDYYKLRS